MSNCKHKYKIHEIYWLGVFDGGTTAERRAICVCEKCAMVIDMPVILNQNRDIVVPKELTNKHK